MTQAPISVLAVDDHPIFLEGVASVLESMPRMKLVGQAGTGGEAIKLHSRLQPDITLMDLQLPDMPGSEAIKGICRETPQARIIVLTIFEGDAYAAEAIRAGAVGYMLKSELRHELQDTIYAVHNGHRRILASVACALAEQMHTEELSPREIEVLRLAAIGNSNKKIAEQLGLAEGTIKTHMKSVLAKMQARDRTHAVLLGITRGVIRIGASGRLQ